MFLDPQQLERPVLNGLMNGLVAPRPIAWVSTVGTDGTANLAPFSFFNAFSFHPFPTVGIGPGARAGIDKDTLRNARETGELTISTVDESLAGHANATSAEFAPGVDEWLVAGVTRAPSELVVPPRVAESPAAFECRVHEIVDLGSDEVPSNALVIARVVRIYVRDDCVDPELRPLSDPLALVGRMAGNDWVRTRDRFELRRPSSIDPDEVAQGVQGEVGPGGH
jgi:flavin reductase (DIM6/NTAB) family NADH-FMN oxidoreductase RutF